MKIAIFTDSFFPQINGVVTSIIDLSRGMADLGHKIFIVAPEYYSEEEFEYKDIEVLRIPAVDASFYEGFKWSSIMHKPTYLRLKEADIDIIHFMTPITVSVFGILVGKMLKKPIIGTYHTFISELTYIRQFWPKAGSFHQKISWHYTKAFYNRTHLITTPSEFTTKELIDNGCTIPAETVSNGIRLDNFDNSNAAAKKMELNPDGKIILYVGRVSYEKNIMNLLESFSIYAKRNKKDKLVIVGGGPIVEDCKKLVGERGLQDRVIFTGMIKNEELRKSGIFGAADLFVTASTTENQPITVLEAMANSLPAVGTNGMGMPYIIRDNETGLIVDREDISGFADAIERLFTDDELYARLSYNARKMAESHEIGLIISEWEERYRKVMSLPVYRLPRVIKKIGNL